MTNIAYRASALAAFSNAAAAKTVTIPAQVVTGDLMLLAFAGGTNGHGSAPTGWTAVPNSSQTNGVTTDLFYRVAQSGDAGSAATVGQATATRAIATLTAYSGVDTANPIGSAAVFSETVSGTSHSGASLTTTAPGWTARFLFAKDGATASTAFTAPSGYTIRQFQAGSGFSSTNQVALAAADSGADVAPGTQGGTWTLDSATAQVVAVAVPLNPVTSTVTVRPVADVTTAGTTLVGGTSAFGVLADDDPTTYVEVPAGTFTVETKLGTLSAAPSQVTVKYYGAGSPANMTVVTSLVQGTTVIGTLGTETAVVTSETTKTYSLTGPQQAACTNLADLRVRQVVTVA